jgi:hypothetical protein
MSVEDLWLRYQIHLKANKIDLALQDLDEILKRQRTHYGAWVTKARILAHLGNQVNVTVSMFTSHK